LAVAYLNDALEESKQGDKQSLKGNPEFRTVAALTHALGVELRFV
jgi:DNA-binding phage protein